MVAGVAPARACDVAICRAVSDDTDVQSAMQAVVQAIFADIDDRVNDPRVIR